jgi:hypothetical protein
MKCSERKTKYTERIFYCRISQFEQYVADYAVFEYNGADMIELGMPYSDLLADGPVIQSSSSVALANGMTIRRLFEQLKNFRKEIHCRFYDGIYELDPNMGLKIFAGMHRLPVWTDSFYRTSRCLNLKGNTVRSSGNITWILYFS